MENERNNINREYKDRLFKLVFREKILRENREEVCSVLLSEYDEQAHIESEKEIAREELNTLYRKLKEAKRVEDLLWAVDDAGYRNQLLQEYGL